MKNIFNNMFNKIFNKTVKDEVVPVELVEVENLCTHISNFNPIEYIDLLKKEGFEFKNYQPGIQVDDNSYQMIFEGLTVDMYKNGKQIGKILGSGGSSGFFHIEFASGVGDLDMSNELLNANINAGIGMSFEGFGSVLLEVLHDLYMIEEHGAVGFVYESRLTCRQFFPKRNFEDYEKDKESYLAFLRDKKGATAYECINEYYIRCRKKYDLKKK